MHANPKYCLISPCRNEAGYIRRTLDSVIAQTAQPARWIIVDDGSSDGTGEIVAEYATRHPWIALVRRDDRGHRRVGSGVIEAFYTGYETIDPDEFDFVCKLDVDLVLPDRYFEILLARMMENPRIGTCSGKAYFRAGDRLVAEGMGDENAIGAAKFYRVECFRDIGGFVREVMWDGIDGHRCRQRGWIAVSWDDPELRFEHLRPMGSSQKSIWTGRMRHGYGQWFMGTGITYMTASAIFRMMRRPFVLGGVAMWLGYLRSMLHRAPRLDDPELRRFLRRYQWSCLLRGKAAATQKLNDAQAAVWARQHPGETALDAGSAAAEAK